MKITNQIFYLQSIATHLPLLTLLHYKSSLAHETNPCGLHLILIVISFSISARIVCTQEFLATSRLIFMYENVVIRLK